MFQKDWLSKWALYSPEKVAIKAYATGQDISYAQLNRQGCFLAQKLTAQYGLQSGQRLMVLAEHGIEYISLFVAAQKSGIVLVPVNYRLAPPEIDYLIQDCQPSLLLYEPKFENQVKSLQNTVPHMLLHDFTQGMQAHHGVHFEAPQLPEQHPLFILYTSGTTGFPKGAIYCHRMLFWNSINTTQSLEIGPNDYTLVFLPTFHTGGWNVLLTPFLHRGASVGILKRFDATQVLQLIEKDRPQIIMGVPTMLKLMMESPVFEKADLSSLRYIIVGGEALPLEVIEIWHQKGVKIRQGYGLTEVGPNITSLHHNDATSKIGSIGRPNFYVQHKIVNDQNQPVGINQIGELCLKGPMTTQGYWNNPEATAKALVNGWFHTGDLVRQDEQGYLYVVDRKKSMFISGGENVYPNEVERVLRAFEAIDEAAVIGVPNQQWGEVGKAFITLKQGATLDQDQLEGYCLANLAKFKVPKQFEVVPTLPKNDTGKIDRKSLVKL